MESEQADALKIERSERGGLNAHDGKLKVGNLLRVAKEFYM